MAKELTREEFQELVHDVAGRELVSGWGRDTVWKDTTELRVEWQTGGMDGGNCWGGEPSYVAVADPEPNFEDLDKILMKICPEIGLLQYRKIESLINRNSRRQNDYYGNYTDYGVKSLKIDDLWNCLIEFGFIKPR